MKKNVSRPNVKGNIFNKKRLAKSIFLLLLVSLIITSCKKGDIGPQGPQGAAGTAGPQGPAGTANVIYSNWFTPSSYTKDTIYGVWGFSYTTTSEPKITQDILDKGTVIVYGKLNGYNTSIWPTGTVGILPISIVYQLGATWYADRWEPTVTVGSIKVRFTNDHNYYTGISNAHSFRYVIIPGGVNNTSSINLNNYAEVKKAFHIAD